jgi:hypothetical protein
MLSWLDASLAALGHGFVRHWTQVERSYRRPMSRLASRLKFAFFPLLALGAMAWLGWDWSHARSLNSAEDAIFDRVVQWRPFEPKPSGRVVVVEIDECSIDYFRARGEGGWPWSRQRHADSPPVTASACGWSANAQPADARRRSDGDQSLEPCGCGGRGSAYPSSTRLYPIMTAFPCASQVLAAPLRSDPRMILVVRCCRTAGRWPAQRGCQCHP